MTLSERLLKICEKEKIKSTLETTDSWEVMYHLSSMRHNLLEWYGFKKDASLLEIGAEAGAMTELFAERLTKVVALECEEQMLQINERRNKGYTNIDFRIGTMEEINQKEKFDYITLIGTLEKAFLYKDTIDAFQSLVDTCKMHLKDDGVLIIAIDNKTGMKYWAGAPEICSGMAFSGITNDKNVGKPRTFSRVELEKMLDRTGLTSREFYYPIPDYRFVTSMYSDEYLPQVGELRPGNAVYKEGGYQFFEEDLAYDTVCKDGQYPYFADSFLVFARR